MNFTRFSRLSIVIASVFLGVSSSAANSKKVHVVQNLEPKEARLAIRLIEKNGYQVSNRIPFSEGSRTFIITKANGDEIDPASIQLEVMEKADSDAIPKTVFNMKLETRNLSEVLNKVPTPEQLSSVTPVAYQH
jgi:hypothetical protein